MSLDKIGDIYENLLKLLDKGKKAVVITKVNHSKENGEFFKDKVLLSEEELNTNDFHNIEVNLYNAVQQSLKLGKLQFINDENNGTTVVEPYFPEPKLIVLGGGHISKPLVEFAAKVGLNVTVVDDRPSFANTARFPDAKKVICDNFENVFEKLNINNSSFIVIVTRGHRNDMFCLKQALGYDAGYIGMMGSKRRIKIVKEELLEEGYSEEILNKLNAPIGISIGAVSPEEIAVSILAEIISYKRSKTVVNDGLVPYKVSIPEFDPEVMEELAKKTDEPKAVATIVSTKGSVPRKAGAKMIVYSDGRILGSIGGGCSEGEVIITARDIIREGGYTTQTIDMTGAIAEEEGMVCGGIMEVFIERLEPQI